MMWSFRNIPKYLVGSVFGFAVLASIFTFLMHRNVNSPDEAANILFISSWKNSQELFVKNSAHQTSSYPLFPRSTASIGERVVPTGFVGLPIMYGSIAIGLGLWSVFYLTIFFTSVAAIAFWYAIKQIFSEKIATISAILFVAHPAVIYYSARGLFPNMILVDLLIIAYAAALYATRHRARMMGVLACVSAIGAVAVRPPEALVVISLTVVAHAIVGNKEVRKIAGYILGGVVLVAALLFVARTKQWLPGGYQFFSSNSFFDLLFPFGIYPSRIARAGYYFVFELFLPTTCAFLIGFFVAYKMYRNNKKVIAYTSIFVAISLWLFALYGSWLFSDNLQNRNAVTLGVSYVRYWLLFYVLSLPFVAIFIEKVSERWGVLYGRIGIALLVIFGIARATFGSDGLVWVVREVNESNKITQDVLTKVPASSVIAVRAWDKYFFPERSVLQPFPQDIRTFGAVREVFSRKERVFAFIENLKESDRLWLRDNGIVAQEVARYGVNTLYELGVWKTK